MCKGSGCVEGVGVWREWVCGGSGCVEEWCVKGVGVWREWVCGGNCLLLVHRVRHCCPVQLKKISESSRKLKNPVFGPMWTDTLCEVGSSTRRLHLNESLNLSRTANTMLEVSHVSLLSSLLVPQQCGSSGYYGQEATEEAACVDMWIEGGVPSRQGLALLWKAS